MQAIRSKDMKPEIALRRLAYALGFRYRLHRHDLPGRPDMACAKSRKAIFVHGCFWHQHSSSECRLTHIPKSNRGYWRPKLERNVARDAQHLETLRAAGWAVLVVWECELTNPEAVSRNLKTFLSHKSS